MTLGQAITQQWQMNTPQNTRSAGVSPHQPPPQPQLDYAQEDGKGSYGLRDERGTSGGAPSQPPYQVMHGQPPQQVGHSQPPIAQGHHVMGGYEQGVSAPKPPEAGVVAVNQQQRDVLPFNPDHEKLHHNFMALQQVRQGGIPQENTVLAARGGDQQQHVAGHGGYIAGGGSRPPNLPQVQASNVQRSGQPQGVNHASHYAGQVPPAPAAGPAHAYVHEPPADATLYQNVHYRNDGSESAIYQNARDLLQLEAKSEGNLENTNVTQEIRKLIQQYPDLAQPPLPQKDTEQPALDDGL